MNDYFKNKYRLKDGFLTAEEFLSKIKSVAEERAKITKDDIDDIRVEFKENDPDKNVIRADLVFTLKGPTVDMYAGKVNVPYKEWGRFGEYIRIQESRVLIPTIAPEPISFIYHELQEYKKTKCLIGFVHSNITYSQSLEHGRKMTDRERLYLMSHENKNNRYSNFLDGLEVKRMSGIVLVIKDFDGGDDTFLTRYFIRICYSQALISFVNTELYYLIPETVYIDCWISWEVWMFYYFNARNFRDQLLLTTRKDQTKNFYYTCLKKRKEALMLKEARKIGKTDWSSMKVELVDDRNLNTKDNIHDKLHPSIKFSSHHHRKINDGKTRYPYLPDCESLGTVKHHDPLNDALLQIVLAENMTPENRLHMRNNLTKAVLAGTMMPEDPVESPTVDDILMKVLGMAEELGVPTASSLVHENRKRYKTEDTFGYFDCNDEVFQDADCLNCEKREICPGHLNRLPRLPIELNKSWYMLTPDDKLRGSRKNVSYNILLSDLGVAMEDIKKNDSRFSYLRKIVLLMHTNYRFIFEEHTELNSVHFPTECGIQQKFISGLLEDQILEKPVMIILSEDIDLHHAYILC